jgi:two-component system LytT family response regulator
MNNQCRQACNHRIEPSFLIKFPFILVRLKPRFFTRIEVTDISFIETEGHYAKLVTTKDSYLIRTPLTQLEQVLPADLFCRVHRAYIVQLNRIIHINENLIQLENKDIPLGKLYRKNLFDRMQIIKIKSIHNIFVRVRARFCKGSRYFAK